MGITFHRIEIMAEHRSPQ